MRCAKDIMTQEVITVSPEMEIAQVAKILFEHHLNGLPVVDANQNLVGILCQSDLIAQQKQIPLPSIFTLLDGMIPLPSSRNLEREIKKIMALTVADAMTPNPTTVSPETTLEEVATLMVDHRFHTLPVVENGRLAGIIGKEDVLKTLIENQ